MSDPNLHPVFQQIMEPYMPRTIEQRTAALVKEMQGGAKPFIGLGYMLDVLAALRRPPEQNVSGDAKPTFAGVENLTAGPRNGLSISDDLLHSLRCCAESPGSRFDIPSALAKELLAALAPTTSGGQ